jgi:two-component system nitrogen regulation sensor histidine kinase NtrY
MAYRHYNSALFVRLSFVIFFAVLIGYFFSQASYYIALAILLAEIVLVFQFVRFLNKTHKQMNYFVQAIKNEDTTLRFPIKTGNVIINELHQSLNELNGILQEVQVKSKIKEKYFGEILQNIATGVVVLTEDGYVTDVNSAALELLGLQTFTHIKQLDQVDSKFTLGLSELKNRQKKVLDLILKKERIQVISRCSVIRLENEDVKLITLQDIRGELERKEIDAWVKLIRVLSHEIMNSLAPVTSISQSLQRIWEQKLGAISDVSEDIHVEKTINGLGVITEMSEALIRFVQSYRVLSKAPEPKLDTIDAHSFFDRLNILLSPVRESFTGDLKLKPPVKSYPFIADEQMMVQVIINLVKNAAEAFNGQASELNSNANISVTSIKKGEITEIRVSDNGCGIDEEIADEIFIPFFTTKENGSGIGLSYSRQIMRAHGGSLLCRSKVGETVFTVRW